MRSVNSPTNQDFHGLVEHFLALPSRDRIAIFGELLCAADICTYVESMLCAPQNTLVVHDPAPDLAGVMHLVFRANYSVLSLSVASWARRQGIGSLLLRRAVQLAQLREANILYVRNLGNPGFRRLVQRMGIPVAWGSDARSAQLELPSDKQDRPRNPHYDDGTSQDEHLLPQLDEVCD